VKSLQCEPPKILTHSPGMCLDEVYNQLLDVGGRWSAGLPFWTRKVLANGGKPNDGAPSYQPTIAFKGCHSLGSLPPKKGQPVRAVELKG
jgi:hypothetical protein